MKFKSLVLGAASVALLASTAVTAKPVGIVSGVMDVAGISRNQDNANTIHAAFTKTSRPCPPFCIQPTHPFAPASVDTVTELDMIHAARDVAGGDTSVMVIDARTPAWTKAAKGGTIKGAVNIPFNTINSKALAKDPMAVVEILTDQMGVILVLRHCTCSVMVYGVVNHLKLLKHYLLLVTQRANLSTTVVV